MTKRKTIYRLEVGVLLDKNNEEFEFYQVANFFEEFGFYDENRIFYFTLDEALKYAKEYIKEGVVNTYSIIESWEEKLTEREIKDIEESGNLDDRLDNPHIENTLYFAYKDNNAVIEKINKIKGEQNNG